MVEVSLKDALGFIEPKTLGAVKAGLAAAHEKLETGNGEGGEFTGWFKLPANYDREEFGRIKAAAGKIKGDSEVLLVIGIGGSYLGARAALEFIHSGFYNLKKKDTPDVYFVGNNLSAAYIRDILGLIEGRSFSINVISKSGTTTEPAVAFRIFKKALVERYGPEESARRIYATTDKARGTLKTQADAAGWQTFVVPDDIGGRFSVLTAVGLLPCAVAGLDIDTFMDGAREAMEACGEKSMDNPAWAYAAARNALYRKGYKVEVLACYEPGFRFMAEWWKQLYGESEGKQGLGIFPASVELTADLHSMGQYIQEGERILMETVVDFDVGATAPFIEEQEDGGDGLNYLAGVSVDEVNRQARTGSMLAHFDGGVPNILIKCGAMNERTLGQLVYVFELACGLSGYVLGVNPFDQPGVEAYKKNMFALLGKPGYEELGEKLRQRL